ncbi:MAG: ABC transporter ATP-binding protein, partial [Candidatus Eremiobacteraeota bacterium]|nr:ABC transporter ATP-binding protein [Candidatus Eremiobacteraeota bacterium]
MTPGTALLETRDLHVAYGDFEALHGVSLEIREGEIAAIVGANGAGKSTLLRAVAGLTPPRSGEIAFAGERVDGLSPRALVERGIALVLEARQLFAEMTVEDNLLVGAEARASGRARTNLAKMYARFPILAERKTQLAGTLSGGEQQMAAIARALMSEPRLLLLDEPSLGLAPRIVTQIFEWVAEINAAGTTVVLVEQNVGASLKLAQHA